MALFTGIQHLCTFNIVTPPYLQWRTLVQLHRCAAKKYSYLALNNNNNSNNVEGNGKLSHLFISSKTATLVPMFAVEDLPLDRTATLVPVFAVKDLLLGRKL